MSLLDIIPVIRTLGRIEREETKAFELGKELGREQATEEAFSLKFAVSEPLTEDDEKKLRDFLVENNLSICFDTYLGGLRIRSLMSSRDHAKEMAARKMERGEFLRRVKG